MSLFDRFQQLAAARQTLLGDGAVPFGVVVEKVLSATEAIVDGRPTILAGTNNYLGLTFDPACLEAARGAVLEQGTGTTGSRMTNGTFAAHRALEEMTLARDTLRQKALMTQVYSDIIYTGTPGETTQIKPGDICEVEIEGIGVLRNKVTAAP